MKSLYRNVAAPSPIYGVFEGCYPAIFTPFEAWVFGIHGGRPRWRAFDAFDVHWGAGVMSRAEFNETFGELPPLPDGAFVNPKIWHTLVMKTANAAAAAIAAYRAAHGQPLLK
jgi:hypothetical protein